MHGPMVELQGNSKDRKGRKGLDRAEIFGLILGDQNSRLRLGVNYSRRGIKVERTESPLYKGWAIKPTHTN